MTDLCPIPYTPSGNQTAGALDTLFAVPINTVAAQVHPATRDRTRTTTASVPDATPTAIASWTTGVAASGDIGYASGVFTCVTAGMYAWWVSMLWPDPGSSYTGTVEMFLNGTVDLTQRDDRAILTGTNRYVTHSGAGYRAAGDTLQAYLIQHSGGTLTPTPQAIRIARMPS